MGSIVYDWLHESVFFDDSVLNSSFQSISDAQIVKELCRYREWAIANMDSLRAEATNQSDRVSVMNTSRSLDVPFLAQCAWYVPRFIVNDPLFALTRERNDLQKPLEQIIGLKEPPLVDRGELTKILRQMKSVVPMVASNYLKIVPFSYFFEGPKEIPLTYSETGFADSLPRDLMEWFRSKATVLPVEVKEGRLTIVSNPKEPLSPRRQIAISYGEGDSEHLFVYQLFKQQLIAADDESRVARFIASLPSDPPDPPQFEAWIQQSIHQAARNIYGRLLRENAMAFDVGAQYITTSDFFAEVIQRESSPRDIPLETMNALLSLDVQFAPEVSISTLMRVRSEEGEAFEAFRLELERHFRDISAADSPQSAILKASNAVHELEAVQVAAVDRQITRLRNQGFLVGGTLVATLAASVATSGWSLLNTAAAAVAGYRSMREYRSDARKNPAFFLWRAKRVQSGSSR
jgi:hypothetical protein